MKPLPIIALAAALTAASAATPALADTVSLNVPATGVTLLSDDVAMSLYFIKAADEGFEVVATYVSNKHKQPNRIVMNLSDGDHVRFGLPGHQGTLYEFARSGDVLTVSDWAAAQDGF